MTTQGAALLRRSFSTPRARDHRRTSPFLKWAGGKSRLLPALERRLPKAIDRMRYVEPFVGGGAMFFSRRPQRARITDVNPELVNTYQVVKNDVDGLLSKLATLARRHSKEHFYEVRNRYNTRRSRLSASSRAACFIYLNKTCFNGLHRVNRKGEFNVPVGSYKNPKVADAETLRAASNALRSAEIACEGFESLVEQARPGDFIYLDPPYVPVSLTANFTGYAAGSFGMAEQEKLANVFRVLSRRGCKLMLSNSDVPVVRELYQGFSIDSVEAPRLISRDGSNRKSVSEVVVRNYQR